MVWNRKRSTGRPGVNPLKPCGRNWNRKKRTNSRSQSRRQKTGTRIQPLGQDRPGSRIRRLLVHCRQKNRQKTASPRSRITSRRLTLPSAMHRLRRVHLIPAQRHRMHPETSKPVRMKTLTVRTVRILPDRRRRSRFPQNRNSLIPGRMLMAGRILPVPKKTRWMLIPGPRIHPERNRSPDPEQRKAMFCLPVKTRQPRLFQKDSRMIRLWTQAKRQTLLQHRQPATQTGKPV